MNLQHRIDLLVRLGEYIFSDDEKWLSIKEKAGYENGWFTPEFVTTATEKIDIKVRKKAILESWIADYPSENETMQPQKEKIKLDGNIELAGCYTT